MQQCGSTYMAEHADGYVTDLVNSCGMQQLVFRIFWQGKGKDRVHVAQPPETPTSGRKHAKHDSVLRSS